MEESESLRALSVSDEIKTFANFDLAKCSYAEARKVYTKAAIRVHPDKNVDNFAEATECFKLLLAAWEDFEYRYSQHTAAPDAESKSHSRQYHKHKTDSTRNTSFDKLSKEFYTTRDQESQHWEAMRKPRLNNEDGLKKMLDKSKPARAGRVMTHCFSSSSDGSDDVCKIKLDPAVSYKASTLLDLMKKQEFSPALHASRRAPVFLLCRRAKESFGGGEFSSPGNFRLIGGRLDENEDYEPSQTDELYLLTTAVINAKHCSSTQARAIQTLRDHQAVGTIKVVEKVVAKQKKAKPPKCSSCELNYPLLKKQLQACCKCKSTFHRDCMPLWLARKPGNKDSPIWYALTCGVRDNKGQKWASCEVPPRHLKDVDMPDLLHY